MPYLIKKDYSIYIQGDLLRQLTQADDSKRLAAERSAMQAIGDKLKQRYDLNCEFTETLPYKKDKVYGAAERAFLDLSPGGFTEWVAGAHAAGDLVINSGIGYACQEPFTDTEFNAAQWDIVAPQYTMFYGAYPSECTLQGVSNPATYMEPYSPVFNYKNLYLKGDIVFWKGYTYECAQNSMYVSHQLALQYTTVSNVPFANVFPDDPIANAQGKYWANKTAYTIPAGTSLTDPLWVIGDNRNQTVLYGMVCMSVFKLSPLLAPKNRPETWLDDYKAVHRELNEVARGDHSLTLPLRQTAKGYMTTFGGEVKRKNNM